MASSIRAAVAAWVSIVPRLDRFIITPNTATAISVPQGVKDGDLRSIVKSMGIEIGVARMR